MILPTARLGVLLVVFGLTAGLASLAGLPDLVAWSLVGLVVAAVAMDLVWSVRPRQIEVSRRMPERLCVGARNQIPLEVRNTGAAPVSLRVLDEAPWELAPSPQQLRTVVGAGSSVTVEYTVEPRARGDAPFGGANLRWAGPLGLVMRQKRVACEEVGRVYPHYVDYSRYLLEARMKLRREGPQRLRVAQRADEFESLREYVPGDDTRRLDWKATARQRRLMVRNYEEERSKDIMILVDAGRMMAPTANGLSKLDHAINAAIMVASVAAERKDKVGLLVFDSEPRLFIPPAHGKDQIQKMLDGLYNVQVRLVEPDFAAAFTLFRARHRKRCLVVLFTDLIDPESSIQLLSHVSALASRHMPLAITIRDQALENAATRELGGASDVYARAIAEHVVHDRSVALAQLRRHGVHVMDVAPEHVTVEAVSRYLQLRATGSV